MTTALVRLWGTDIGAVTMERAGAVAEFAYDRDFLRSGIEVAPLTMPLDTRRFRFPELPKGTFHGLPGLLADTLPDRFGNALINAWLARSGRSPDSFNAVERLCYTGSRGLGALEFHPATGPPERRASPLEIAALVDLASRVLSERNSMAGALDDEAAEDTLTDILRVGTSAGGARAKAVIAWNPKTGEVRSGQADAPPGFEHWLLKFDGVSGNADKELADPIGYGALEFAYSEMARTAGVEMNACKLFEEGSRRHFMTRRFDRTADGGKLHMLTLGAIAHYDFNAAGAHSYEQALRVCRDLQLPIDRTEQLFRRMVFNLVARNQDDHVKNIAFLMDRRGRWTLAPAYDVTWAFNPAGDWTATHQMTVNGKRDGFELADLVACSKVAFLARTTPARILDDVLSAVRRWPEFASAAGVPERWAEDVGRTHRLEWSG